jgi:hypothetical protein
MLRVTEIVSLLVTRAVGTGQCLCAPRLPCVRGMHEQLTLMVQMFMRVAIKKKLNCQTI